MENFLRNHYGYGVARLPIPTQVVTSVEYNRWQWLYHPSLIGLLGLLLITGALRSCSTTLIRPEKTILWVHHTPTVKPEKIQPRTPPPVIPRPLRKEPEIIKETPPPLLVPQKAMPKPEQLMLKKPIPLPQPKVPMERLLEKQMIRPDNQPLPQPKMAELQPAKTMAALSQRQEIDPSKTLSAMNNKSMPAPPQPAPTTLTSRQMERPNIKLAQTEFVPLQPSATPSQISSLTAQKQPSGNRAQLIAGERMAAAPAIPSGSNLPAVRAATAAQAGNTRGRQTTFPPNTGFAPDLVKTPAVSNLAKEDSNTGGDDERVEIVGRVIGESPRIEALKRTIFEKATVLNWRYGPYCCTINGITCKLKFISNQKISISFSQDNIPFEVLSKLERRLPEGLRSCAH